MDLLNEIFLVYLVGLQNINAVSANRKPYQSLNGLLGVMVGTHMGVPVGPIWVFLLSLLLVF